LGREGKNMNTMAVSLFKAHALEVVSRVAALQESVIITKRGKPLAQVVPFRSMETAAVRGGLASTLVFEKDIVSPLGPDMWDALR
jgi:prevent-host-death family protein